MIDVIITWALILALGALCAYMIGALVALWVSDKANKRQAFNNEQKWLDYYLSNPKAYDFVVKDRNQWTQADTEKAIQAGYL